MRLLEEVTPVFKLGTARIEPIPRAAFTVHDTGQEAQ